jgi:hypothetical protein
MIRHLVVVALAAFAGLAGARRPANIKAVE